MERTAFICLSAKEEHVVVQAHAVTVSQLKFVSSFDSAILKNIIYNSFAEFDHVQQGGFLAFGEVVQLHEEVELWVDFDFCFPFVCDLAGSEVKYFELIVGG
jgi:hypothetical protein